MRDKVPSLRLLSPAVRGTKANSPGTCLVDLKIIIVITIIPHHFQSASRALSIFYRPRGSWRSTRTFIRASFDPPPLDHCRTFSQAKGEHPGGCTDWTKRLQRWFDFTTIISSVLAEIPWAAFPYTNLPLFTELKKKASPSKFNCLSETFKGNVAYNCSTWNASSSILCPKANV